MSALDRLVNDNYWGHYGCPYLIFDDESGNPDNTVKQAAIELSELRKILIETRDAWRKTGQPINDIWERGTVALKDW